jgi:hypothetical protein
LSRWIPNHLAPQMICLDLARYSGYSSISCELASANCCEWFQINTTLSWTEWEWSHGEWLDYWLKGDWTGQRCRNGVTYWYSSIQKCNIYLKFYLILNVAKVVLSYHKNIFLFNNIFFQRKTSFCKVKIELFTSVCTECLPDIQQMDSKISTSDMHKWLDFNDVFSYSMASISSQMKTINDWSKVLALVISIQVPLAIICAPLVHLISWWCLLYRETSEV